MVTVYHDADADPACLRGLTIAVIGYGNQGRAQSLNLRDSGLRVLVGCPQDEYAQAARGDGFEVSDVAEAAAKADVVLLLIPDEVQPAVYEASIRSGLQHGKTLCFASGYNIHFKLIEPPAGVNVVMVAPRMIGKAVRTAFVEGRGFPCFIAVGQDADGKALRIALAIARGIGGTRAGAFVSSFEEEVLIDLFAEQFLWAGIVRLCRLYYDVLVEAGCAPEAVATDMYLSGEMVEIARAMAEVGFFKQLGLHSQTSQYGQLSRGKAVIGPEVEHTARRVLEGIRNGDFAREWEAEQQRGKPLLASLKGEAFAHPLNEVERSLSGKRQGA
jgi:ketol-acid reductoisomerase